MSKKDSMVESYIRKTTIVEEFLDIDESLIELEKNKDLIRMEMNIIEFPIFSRSKKLKKDQIKKYYFASDKTSYLEVVPGNKETIPGELEERVFIALLKIFKNNGYKQAFYCTMSDILENMNVTNRNSKISLYPKVRQAIYKLATTTFKFKNLFYSNELKKSMDDLIVTNILTYRSVTFKESNEEEKNYFNDKRIKEVFKIMLASHFYENIIRKGYLAFDADELLNIKDSITRSIYTMITKWRNNELYLRRPAFYIARRVPLAWKKDSIRKTIPRIEKSLDELKEFGYITNYKTIKEDKLDKTEFEIFFSQEHNKIKRETFYDEKSNFYQMIHLVEERQNELDIVNTESFNDPQFIEILDVFGEPGKKLKTLPGTIKEALKKYEHKYVKYTAEYTAINCKISYLKYFKEALEKNWADEYIAKKETKLEKQVKSSKSVIEEAQIVEEPKETELNSSWEEFEELDETVKEILYQKSYTEFLISANGKDNKTMKNIFEKSKKSLILKNLEVYKKMDLMSNNNEQVKEKIKENAGTFNVVLSDTFISVSMFMVRAVGYLTSSNLNIDTQAFMLVFTHLKEYEDENIIIKYNESTKIGEIIKKM